MSKTVVMTLRLPVDVARRVQGLARRFGHKPAQLGARLVEEGLRRRDHPQIDLRDTEAGRVAYIAGTRFAVYWVAESIRAGGLSPLEFAAAYDVPVERVRAALAYSEAFPQEIQADIDHTALNRQWIESQDAASRVADSARGDQRRSRRKARR